MSTKQKINLPSGDFSSTSKEKTSLLFLTSDLINSLKRIPRAHFPLVKEISLDLGISRCVVHFIAPDKFIINERLILLPENLFFEDESRSIFICENNSWKKWHIFDEQTNKFYKMIYVAPAKPPTIEISGIKMHITQNSDPAQDTSCKIKSFKYLRGLVLDTCTGLGYTAIASAQNSAVLMVYTCENDINVHRLSRQNPWSQSLFSNPKIKPMLMSVDQLVTFVPSKFFDSIIHDPPRYGLATELYSPSFYQNLYRILKKGGELYHYTGDPQRRIRRIPLAIDTQRRLKEIGFRAVKLAYNGVIAQK